MPGKVVFAGGQHPDAGALHAELRAIKHPAVQGVPEPPVASSAVGLSDPDEDELDEQDEDVEDEDEPEQDEPDPAEFDAEDHVQVAEDEPEEEAEQDETVE